MKNHWLDKKADKALDLEIDKACEGAFTKAEFNAGDFIDLCNVSKHNDRYKEYDRLAMISEEDFVNKVMNKPYDINTSTDAEDRAMVVAILQKNMHKTHWVEEVLTDAKYAPHYAPGCGNLTINCGLDFAATSNYVTPGGDGITLNDNTTVTGDFPGVSGDLPGWKDGKIVDMDLWKGKCDKCGEYQWPMNNEITMGQGDPICACYRDSCNLEIWYGTPYIQNEKLQVLADINTSITQYQTMYTSVMAGTMTGTIYPTPGNTSYGFTFVVSSSGKFTLDQFVQDSDGKVEFASKQKYASDEACLEALANGTYDDRFMGWYDEVYATETSLNLTTGVLELHYHMGHQPEIIVSYEYNLECDGRVPK